MEVDETQIAFRLKRNNEQLSITIELLKVFSNPNYYNFELH
jgi:hypothetical protein